MRLGCGMMKLDMPKALLIKIYLLFLIFFFIAYLFPLLHKPFFARCILNKKVEEKLSMKLIKDNNQTFLLSSHGDSRIALVNMDDDDDEAVDWEIAGPTMRVRFDRVAPELEWKDLFPDWIDEEKPANATPRSSCPDLPMPDFSAYEEVDMVVARLPCRHPEPDWARDVHRLQVHLVAANLVVRKAARDEQGRVRIVFIGACRPMMEVFPAGDMVRKDGNRWFYEVDVERLEEKVAMPVGSCNLAMPLWYQGTDKGPTAPANSRRREAYATVLHSSDAYVCGTIMLAQSLRRTGTRRHLVLLHDNSIPPRKLGALASAGWKLRQIRRIRNTAAKKHAYNEYNYSKLRVWQLTDYRKVVFIDADILVLRNLDVLFGYPEISAAANNRQIFNSGVMVIEPSNATFQALMDRRRDIVSYNGGDQGFLNEVFVWWHRLPHKANFMKISAPATAKERLYDAEPPAVCAIHYLGMKPWSCHRDYDCNWNVQQYRAFASDAAHRRWWRLHDDMPGELRRFCRLSKKRVAELEIHRRRAEEARYEDGHWRTNISDRRSFI